MDELAMRRSPLESRADAMMAVAGPTLHLREAPFLAQVNLRGDATDPAFVSAVRAALGLDLPDANHFTETEDHQLLWLGPDEWQAVGGVGSEAALTDRLRKATEGLFAAVCDVSANRTCIELSGPLARTVLDKGCTIDLHPRAFGPGRMAQTLLARAQVILQQTAPDTYRLFVRNSFSGYLADWLVDAAALEAA